MILPRAPNDVGQVGPQVVAMVTDGQERPEIPEAAELPGGTLTRHEDYLHLMRRCWAQVRAAQGLTCPGCSCPAWP